jgi:hypothetical protein
MHSRRDQRLAFIRRSNLNNALEKYRPDSIQNQVEHHRSRTFPPEDLAFLKRHEHSTRGRLLMPGLSFDDKYLWD